jgi:hypothetical protein
MSVWAFAKPQSFCALCVHLEARSERVHAVASGFYPAHRLLRRRMLHDAQMDLPQTAESLRFGSKHAAPVHRGSAWPLGGGVKGGMEYGKADDFSYNIVEKPVYVRDFHATVMHCLGIDHERLTVPFRGLDVKLTGVKRARVEREVLV